MPPLSSRALPHPLTIGSGSINRRAVCARVATGTSGRTGNALPPEHLAAAPESLRTLDDLKYVKGKPILGMLLDFLKPDFDFAPFYDGDDDNILMNFGQIWAPNLEGGGDTLVTRNPDAIRDILTTKSAQMPMFYPEAQSNLVFPAGAQGLGATDADIRPWRKATIQAMSQDVVMKYQVPQMVEQFQSLIGGHAQSGVEFRWWDEAKGMAFNVAARSLLPDVSREELEDLLPVEIERSNGVFAMNWGLKEGVPFTQYWRSMQAKKEITRFFEGMFSKVLEASDRAAVISGGTAIGRFLAILEEEGVVTKTTTNAEIADRLAQEMQFLTFVGTDSSSFQMTHLLTNVARHPEWLQALWEEQQRLMAEHGTSIDRKVLSRSAVALAIIQESLRLSTAPGQLHRYTAEDTTVGDVRVPAGHAVVLDLKSSCQRAGNGSPDFDPQQWLSEDRTQATPMQGSANVAFGAGPRKCVGQKLATIELLVFLAVLAREVQDIVVSEDELKTSFRLCRHPTKCPVRFVARNA